MLINAKYHKSHSVYLSYIDTSGGPEKSDRENFVVASVIINDNEWHHMNKEIRDIKVKHFPDLHPDGVELHVKEMLNHTGIYKGMSLNATYSILNDLFEFISTKEIDLKIIGTVTDKRIKRSRDVETFGYIPVFERFNCYLAQKNESFKKAREMPEHGIVIIDSAGIKDQKIQSKLVPILKKCTSRSNFNYLITNLLFTDSRWDNMIQTVDCIAYCIRKCHRTNNTDDIHLRHWQKYYSMLEHKFYSKDGQYDVHGLKMI